MPLEACQPGLLPLCHSSKPSGFWWFEFHCGAGYHHCPGWTEWLRQEHKCHSTGLVKFLEAWMKWSEHRIWAHLNTQPALPLSSSWNAEISRILTTARGGIASALLWSSGWLCAVWWAWHHYPEPPMVPFPDAPPLHVWIVAGYCDIPRDPEINGNKASRRQKYESDWVAISLANLATEADSAEGCLKMQKHEKMWEVLGWSPEKSHKLRTVWPEEIPVTW